MRGETNIHLIRNQLPSLLIIDDSTQIIDFVSGLFETEYSCYNATDGEAGVSKAEHLLPDIILCDVKMPGKSGLDVVKELKNNPRTRFIPIILLSGYNSRENRLEGLRAMADDFIAKPFDYEELRLKMSNLLQIRKDIQQKGQEDLLDRDLGLDSSDYNHDEKYFIELMLGFYANHYASKELNVNDIANHVDISIRQLQRKVKAITGLSPMDLLRIYRLRQSSKLLKRHKSIAEVSEACGFRSPNYFCTCFKDYFQITPSKYQRN